MGTRRLIAVLAVLGLGLGLGPTAGAAGKRQEGVAPKSSAAAGATAGSGGTPTMDSLSAAYRKSPTPEALLQLGLLAHAEGRPLEARDRVRRALADGNLKITSELREKAEAVMQAALGESSELRLAGQRGALVLIDARPCGVLPLALPILVAPGKHTVQLELGSKRWQAEATAPAGRTVDIRFAPDTNAAIVTTQPAVLLLPAAEKEGAIPLELLRTIDRALRRASLARASIEGQPGQPLGGVGCIDDPACRLQLGEQRTMDYVLSLKSAAAGSGYQASFELTEVTIGDIATRGSVRCDSCDLAALSNQLGQELERKLTEAVTRPRGEIYVTSNPATAQVYRGATLLGSTPLKRPAWVGTIALTLRLPGHRPSDIQLTVVENQTARQSVQLSALPTPAGGDGVQRPGDPLAPRPPQRPRWRLAVGGLALGAGLLMAGFGATALAIDGTCARAPVPPAELCDGLFQTQTLGIGLTAAGGALSLGGIILLALPPPKPR